jgi:4-amino-4-deoxy-L-arabinose transferase-like glycosyltransferase
MLADTLHRTVRVAPRFWVLGAILLLALDLRVESVLHSVVDGPVRADARDYVMYAYNLERHGIYSAAGTWQPDAPAPAPDAMRSPLYPLFLTLFLDQPPTVDNLRAALLGQALLGTLTVALAYALARTVLAVPFALAASALAALSPHLVTMTIYLLSETLLCFALVLALLCAARWLRRGRPGVAVATGVLLAAAALAHPLAQYFVIVAAGYLLVARELPSGRRSAVLLVLGFALGFGPWLARNAVSVGGSDPTLMLAALRAGAYPNLMYQNRPETYGYPYRADPGYAAAIKDPGATARAIVQAFREQPWAQTRWYLFGKPALLYSWNNVEGQGDVFVYPTPSSPYTYLPVFELTHALMRHLHGLLVVLMAIGAVLAWLPVRWTLLSADAAFAARMISLLLAYHLAVMVVGFPLPRYSIALRPFLYVMALLPLAAVLNRPMPDRIRHAFR